MRLGLKIALRFLKSNKGQAVLIIIGIAIGVSVQVFIGSLIQGLQNDLIDKTIGSSSQITIKSLSADNRIEDYENIMKKAVYADNRITTASAADDNPAFLKVGEKSQSILVRGFDLEKADSIYNFKKAVVDGEYAEEKNEIMLGIDLKKEYGLAVGDSVIISTVNGVSQSCKVIGFYDLKVTNINKTWAITSFETSKEIFGGGETVSAIEMQVDRDYVFDADGIAKKVKQGLESENLEVTNWKNENEQLLSGLKGQSISSLMIQIFVLISVALGIASVLAITVMQKSRQIGILKAMGIKNRTSSYIFLSEGLILGVAGTIFGITLGILLSFAFTKFAVNADGTPVVGLYINYSFIAFSGCVAIAASILAAIVPAIRSSKLDPIDIIRSN